jgi:hypothetical protein
MLGMAMLNLLGCRAEEDITRTTERRVDYEKKETPKSDKVPTRILAVIAPGDEGQSWFFKLMGPADDVAKAQSAFDAFVASIEFANKADKPVTWVLPEGWRDGPKKSRYATILIGAGDEPLELTVISAGGNLLDNVNRWRGQVGLDPLKQENLSESSREVTTKQGKKVTRVDVSGMAEKGPQMPPFMKGKR